MDTVAAAGASGFTFQLEAVTQAPLKHACSVSDWASARDAAGALAARVRAAGMRAGVALSPATPVGAVLPLAQEGAVDLVRR